jgi:hypothetical protein
VWQVFAVHPVPHPRPELNVGRRQQVVELVEVGRSVHRGRGAGGGGAGIGRRRETEPGDDSESVLENIYRANIALRPQVRNVGRHGGSR